MANQPVRITKRQAKRQINCFGVSLILYIVYYALLHYGVPLLEKSVPGLWVSYLKLPAWMDGDLLVMAAGIAGLLISVFVCFAISSRKLDLNIHNYLGKRKIKPLRRFGLSCVAASICLIVMSVLTLFTFFMRTQNQRFTFIGDYSTALNIEKNIVYFVLYVVVVPLCDEVIFRGVIQRQLGHYGRYFGVLGSAFLYMLAQVNPMNAMMAFFLGWFLSLVTLKYHSIRPAMGIHMFAAMFIEALNMIPGKYLWLMSILMVVVYITAAVTITSLKNEKVQVRWGATEGKLWGILLSSWSIIVCILLFAANMVLAFVTV